MLWLFIFSLLLLEKSRYNTIAAKTRKHTISLHFVMAFQKPTNLFLAKQVNNRCFDKMKRRKNFVKRRFGKFFRCLDVYWVYRSGLNCRKIYYSRLDYKMKKRGYRFDTLFCVSVMTDLLFDSQFGFHFRRQSVFVDLNIDGFIPYECFGSVEVSVVFAAIAP